eukprot:SAG31_NODE_682_length_12841_cov_13.637655_7_plen_475_part_00
MEQLKSSYRPFKSSNASINSLSGDCDYYRVTIDSRYKSSGTDTDANYDLKQVFPNARTNLMDGEWSAYLEEFHMRGFSSHKLGAYRQPIREIDTFLRVCLPDLIKPSKDFVLTANGIKNDNTLAIVPQSVVLKTTPKRLFNGAVSFYPEGKAYYDNEQAGNPPIQQGNPEIWVEMNNNNYPGPESMFLNDDFYVVVDTVNTIPGNAVVGMNPMTDFQKKEIILWMREARWSSDSDAIDRARRPSEQAARAHGPRMLPCMSQFKFKLPRATKFKLADPKFRPRPGSAAHAHRRSTKSAIARVARSCARLGRRCSSARGCRCRRRRRRWQRRRGRRRRWSSSGARRASRCRRPPSTPHSCCRETSWWPPSSTSSETACCPPSASPPSTRCCAPRAPVVCCATLRCSRACPNSAQKGSSQLSAYQVRLIRLGFGWVSVGIAPRNCTCFLVTRLHSCSIGMQQHFNSVHHTDPTKLFF